MARGPSTAMAGQQPVVFGSSPSSNGGAFMMAFAAKTMQTDVVQRVPAFQHDAAHKDRQQVKNSNRRRRVVGAAAFAHPKNLAAEMKMRASRSVPAATRVSDSFDVPMDDQMVPASELTLSSHALFDMEHDFYSDEDAVGY
eukprot:Opistho-2@58774